MLELVKVRKSYAGQMVVAEASLRLAAGEALCITGPSGAGKSTLLEIMAGLIRPDGGLVRRAAPASLLFQDDALIPWLTAAENLAYILPRRLDEAEKTARIRRWLERFGLDGHIYPPAMSGGMRRRLGLARLFASARPLLLLDEPFAFLDQAWQEVAAREMAVAVTAGAALVLTSHDLDPLQLPCFSSTPCRIARAGETPLRLA
ncbi:MAG: ATP-binding cassette domain-containing protein [Deltaproteobacteria bacterium]|jgi:NitT/TauT family transport system ATP-binding protein|nr:ATP-binding cassette domain-containing protein [Deltaproteobacteria bacterium]